MRALVLAAVLLTPAGAAGQPAPVAGPAGKARTPTPAPSPSSLALDKLALGDQFLAARDFRLALFAYLDAVNLDPWSVRARLRLADLYARMGHLEHAIGQWEFALALEPGNPEAAQSIAQARVTLGLRAAGLPSNPAPDAGASKTSTPRTYKLTPEAQAADRAGPAPAANPESAARP